MALDRLYQLDVSSPNSNSNYQSAKIDEGCIPSGINNALRALGSMVAQQLCYTGGSISASVSTNLVTATTGLLIPIVGSGAVNSFGVVPGEFPSAAVIRFLQYSSSVSLSHGGSIRLQGGVSRRTQPGDFQGVVHVGSADVWHEFLWSPADGGIAGGSISLSTVNGITGRIVSLDATSASVSVLNVAGSTEFPRVAFRAAKNSTQSGISVCTTVSWPSETFDIGGYFASDGWTPPAGKYRLSAAVSWGNTGASVGETLTVSIYKNASPDSTRSMVRGSGAAGLAQEVTAIVEANGTDLFTVVAEKPGTAGNLLSGLNTTLFCGERI
jgi:hypothetical protein